MTNTRVSLRSRTGQCHVKFTTISRRVYRIDAFEIFKVMEVNFLKRIFLPICRDLCDHIHVSFRSQIDQ